MTKFINHTNVVWKFSDVPVLSRNKDETEQIKQKYTKGMNEIPEK